MKLDEAFLILSAHFAQTREDKFEAQVRNSFRQDLAERSARLGRCKEIL